MFARRADVVEREATRIGGLAVAGDLTTLADIDRLVAATTERFGGIDVVVLNGGGPPPGAASTVTPEAIRAAVDLLLVPHVHLIGLCLPHLRASGRGRIVAIESTSVKEPIANLALSNAVRPGVVGWLKTLARELGPDGITVNTIAPGRIDTERLLSLYGASGPPPELLAQIPAGRLGSPAEVAAAVRFLASDAAGYISGTVLPVDGGLLSGLS
jgi:3-oxoacyl-[acyl-carrier protein] reductase